MSLQESCSRSPRVLPSALAVFGRGLRFSLGPVGLFGKGIEGERHNAAGGVVPSSLNAAASKAWPTAAGDEGESVLVDSTMSGLRSRSGFGFGLRGGLAQPLATSLDTGRSGLAESGFQLPGKEGRGGAAFICSWRVGSGMEGERRMLGRCLSLSSARGVAASARGVAAFEGDPSFRLARIFCLKLAADTDRLMGAVAGRASSRVSVPQASGSSSSSNSAESLPTDFFRTMLPSKKRSLSTSEGKRLGCKAKTVRPRVFCSISRFS